MGLQEVLPGSTFELRASIPPNETRSFIAVGLAREVVTPT